MLFIYLFDDDGNVIEVFFRMKIMDPDTNSYLESKLWIYRNKENFTHISFYNKSDKKETLDDSDLCTGKFESLKEISLFTTSEYNSDLMVYASKKLVVSVINNYDVTELLPIVKRDSLQLLFNPFYLSGNKVLCKCAVMDNTFMGTRSVIFFDHNIKFRWSTCDSLEEDVFAFSHV